MYENTHYLKSLGHYSILCNITNWIEGTKRPACVTLRVPAYRHDRLLGRLPPSHKCPNAAVYIRSAAPSRRAEVGGQPTPTDATRQHGRDEGHNTGHVPQDKGVYFMYIQFSCCNSW